MADEVTIGVLREIRDGVSAVQKELVSVRDELATRIGAVETAVLDLAEQQRFVVRWLTAGTERDRRLEQEVGALRARVDSLEEEVRGKKRSWFGVAGP